MKAEEQLEEFIADRSSVIRYLQTHPGFLVEHPELLQQMTVPHGIGDGAVSLLEHQTRLLREQLTALQQKLDCQQHRENSSKLLVENFPLLVSGLFECDHRAELLQTFRNFLIQHFDANWVKFFVSSNTLNPDTDAESHIYPLEPQLRGLFCLLLNNPKPLCGSLQQEHVIALFGHNHEKINSTVLIPFQYSGREALLAVASVAWQCYGRGTQLDLLVSLTTMLSGLSIYVD